ncbi:alpha/beta family hydrolase [Cytobacillus kochii]|uniref:alpha/beta family hydrolase n=1 Tax=Cytobacillus kochii TaxID=859143 RepID=UPI00203BB481|nr:alpha/beta family hydrolase [Cytobacillus kochii]MCM3322671.1 alpha/beta hydrolase [Cytobacillus kochii]MCM3344850.1 alpha/beta hydrolase [Cytobacillus kochii]
MKKIIKSKVFLILSALVVTAIGGFFIWTQFTYHSVNEPTIPVDNQIRVEDDWLLFGDPNSQIGIILYPGAKVEPEAYAYIGQELAKENLFIAIPHVTLNIAILDVSKANDIISTYKDVNWFVGGHSMGGAAAAMYADKNIDQVHGLILLGAYASDNDTLTNSKLPVLSISGSNDGLSTPAKVDEKKVFLPDEADFVEIEGGNHAYFGVYGEQSGDNPADISIKKQQETIIDTITHWIKEQKQ